MIDVSYPHPGWGLNRLGFSGVVAEADGFDDAADQLLFAFVEVSDGSELEGRSSLGPRSSSSMTRLSVPPQPTIALIALGQSYVTNRTLKRLSPNARPPGDESASDRRLEGSCVVGEVSQKRGRPCPGSFDAVRRTSESGDAS